MLSDALGNTQIGPLTQEEIVKLMETIAQDVSKKNYSFVALDGKMGAYGFNAQSLETVGVLKPESCDRLLKKYEKEQAEILEEPVVKEWDKTKSDDLFLKLGLEPKIGKRIGVDYAKKAKESLGLSYNLEDISPDKKSNVNFAALATPSMWSTPQGSAAHTFVAGVNTATAAIVGKSNWLIQELNQMNALIQSKMPNIATDPMAYGAVRSAISKLKNKVKKGLSETVGAVDASLKAKTAKQMKVFGRSINTLNLENTSMQLLNALAFAAITSLQKTIAQVDPIFKLVQKNPSSEALHIAVQTMIRLLQSTALLTTTEFINTVAEETPKLGGGPSSFLGNKEAQDKAMFSLLSKNYYSLRVSRVVNDATPKSQVAGLLTVANAQGPEQAIRFAKGSNKTSALTTKTSQDIFNIGAAGINTSNRITTTETPNNQLSTWPLPGIDAQPSNNSMRLNDPQTGFRDPSNRYPKVEEVGRPDTNNLATGVRPLVPISSRESNTILGIKNSSRARLVRVTNRKGETWDQPKSPYAGQYPHVHVFQSESGHLLEFDDTPKAERVHLAHRQGSFIEIDANGTQVNKIVGNGYTVIDKNGYIYIDGRANVNVAGTCNIFVGTDANITVQGKTQLDFHNDVDVNIAGKLNLTVGKGMYVRNDGELSYDGAKVMNINTSEGLNVGIAKDINVISGKGSINFESKNNINVKSDEGKINLQSNDDINLKPSGSVKLGGSTTEVSGILRARSTTNLKAGLINVVGTGASSPSEATLATPPQTLVVDDPIVFMTPQETVHSVPALPTPEESVNMDFDGENGIEDPIQARQSGAQLLEPGQSPPDALEASGQSSRPPVTVTDVPLVDISCGIDYGSSLSKYFTLRQVMVNGKLREYNGFTQQDMIQHMKLVALNCLDPIKDRYPGVILTSGFRDYVPAGGATTSQHLVGQAVDMKFTGYTREQYYDIVQWIAQNIPHDQLMNEYLSGGGCWIHLSFKSQANRYEKFTMYNHHRVSDKGQFCKY